MNSSSIAGITLLQFRRTFISTISSTTLRRTDGGAVRSTRCLARSLCGSSRCRQLQGGADEVGHKAEGIKAAQSIETVQYVSEEQRSSQEDSEEQEHEHLVKQRILKSALEYVPIYGWDKQALEAGASAEGLPPVAAGMFPRGGADLVFYFYTQSNKQLGDILKQKLEEAKVEGLEKPGTTALVREAVETRLRMILPYMDQWPQAMGIQTLPQHSVESWSSLLAVADEIWFHAGDRSTDFNWYTKRLSLAGVYKATEIFMLQDKSHDLQDTWAFLDRRLEDVKALGSCKLDCQQSTASLKESAKGMFIIGRNILGMNSRDR